MAKLTPDAIAVQASMAVGEHVPLHTLALRAFAESEEDKVTSVMLLRTRRACQILKDNGAVTLREMGDAVLVTHVVTEGNTGVQLQAVMNRALRNIFRSSAG